MQWQRVHGAGVRLGGHLLGQVRRVQLRSPPPRDLERAAQRRPVPGGAPAIPHPRCTLRTPSEKPVAEPEIYDWVCHM